MDEFRIYYSDLNREAQKRLLKAFGISSPKEVGWYKDQNPIVTIQIPFWDEMYLLDV